MRVLAACEFSGTVRDAFLVAGHDAWSCDLLPSETPGPHLQRDVRDVVADGWDLMISFPPCTYLCVTGNRWHAGSQQREDALELVRFLLAAPVPRIALENPVGVISTRIRRPDLIIHPWEYGHPESKATCLWLKNLPPLMVSGLEEGRHPRSWLESSGPDQWKRRSRTYPGIARAMADQWG